MSGDQQAMLDFFTRRARLTERRSGSTPQEEQMMAWIRGWWATYQLWRHDRETYEFLVNYKHDPDDFVEVPRPT